MRPVLRMVALAIAVAGVIDPAFALRRSAPPAIDIFAAATSQAAALRTQLIADLGSDVVVGSRQIPASIVLIGAIPEDLTVPDGVPVSTLSLVSAADRSVRIVEAPQPDPVLPGQEAIVRAVVQGTGVAGTTSVITLEQSDVPLARVEHRWSSASEQFQVQLRYAPPAAGLFRLRIVARPVGGERTDADNAVDVGLIARARALRVMSFEPRPSWIAGFVRRALEADPVFDVSSFVRSSRGLAVRTGAATDTLTATALAPFDAVIVGAPEELTPPQVTVLDAFARERGGAVILLPDRRPSGAYLDLVRGVRFDEVLLEHAAPIDAGRSAALRASEFALPDRLGRGGLASATIAQSGGTRAAIVSWPRGSGRVLFSGALDAWRYRGRDEDGFARFWTGTIASLASAAPPVLSLRLEPPVAAPRDRLIVRAAIRQTAFVHEGEQTTVPSIQASLIAPGGAEQMLRLWPAAEVGVFEATVAAPEAGRYDLRVSAAGAVADAPLIVSDDVRHPDEAGDEALRLLAEATGGVPAVGSDLKPLEAHLRSLTRPESVSPVHPLRSPWWILAFGGVLSVEWIARRRKGLA